MLMLGVRKCFCSLTFCMKCKSEIAKGTKVGPAILYCLKGADEAHLPPSGNFRHHHDILQLVCDGIAVMKHAF